MKTITINNLSLSYRDTGTNDKGTLLFLHGAGGSLDQFDRQHEFFSQDFRVLSLSLRGHGNSQSPDPSTLEAYSLSVIAQDVIQFLETLEVQKVHLVGNSAGGVVGYEIARQRPDLLRSLTTFGTTGKMVVPGFLRRFTLWFDTRNVSNEPEKRLRKLAGYTSKHPDVVEIVYQMFLAARPGIPGLRYALGSYDYLGVIRSLQIPYYILKAQYDGDINLVIKSTEKALAEQKQATGLDSRVIPIPKAGHMANLDEPEVFNSKLLELIV